MELLFFFFFASRRRHTSYFGDWSSYVCSSDLVVGEEQALQHRNLWLLAVLQGLFLTNNVTFIAINGLVGLQLAPYAWMATLPVMGYVVGSAPFTGVVGRSQARLGRMRAFQWGLAVAMGSAMLCA